MTRYELVQDGIVVASVEADDADRAWAEIMHYAMMYGQDGAVSISEPDGQDTLKARFAALSETQEVGE